MKTKLSIITVIAVMLFSSCEKNSGPQTEETGPTPIGFGNARVVGATKAKEKTSTFADQDKIGVYANISTDNGSTYTFMAENTEVTYDGTNWEYSPLSYWPVDGTTTLDFFAYHPYSPIAPLAAAGTSVVNSKTKGFAISHWVSDSPADQTDLLWDWVIGATKDKPSGDDGGSADKSTKLAFKHALSKVKFKTQLEDELAVGTKIYVTGIKVSAFQKGVFTTIKTDSFSSGAEGGPVLTTPATDPIWTEQADKFEFVVLANTENLKTFEVTTVATVFAGEASPENYELLMIPQSTTTEDDVIITLNYEVVTANSTVKGVKTFNLFATNWNQGTQYTYTFNLSLDAITFTAKVDAWADDVAETLPPSVTPVP